MANKVSSHLYDLIYSLSSSEKRYFKLFVANHIGKKNDLGIKLFDLIVRSEGKPIEKIEARIKFTKHPSRLKNYLSDLILTSLEAYHAKSSITIRIRNHINQIENLYNKALYEQCVALAKRTLKEAEKIDHQNFKIDILDWFMNALKQLEHKKNETLKRQLQIKQQEAINKLKLEKEFKKLEEAIYGLIKKIGTIHTKENNEQLHEMMDNPLLSDYSLATSYYSKSSFNSIYFEYYRYFDDSKKSSFYIKQNLLLYDDYPAKINLEQFNYITTINNYALSCAGVGNYEMADYYFSKIERVSPTTNQVEVKIFEYLSANRLDIYLRSATLDKSLLLVKDIESGLKKYGKKISELFKIVMYSNLCYLFFATKNYKNALAYNNLILDKETTIYRSDIFRFARIMNLLIHYELGNKLNIDYFYEATERFINRQINIYAFERWFLSFFKALISIKEKNKNTLFKEKEIELIGVLNNKNERKIISHFNILAWIRTKHESISFENAIKDYLENSFEDYGKKRKQQ